MGGRKGGVCGQVPAACTTESLKRPVRLQRQCEPGFGIHCARPFWPAFRSTRGGGWPGRGPQRSRPWLSAARPERLSWIFFDRAAGVTGLACWLPRRSVPSWPATSRAGAHAERMSLAHTDARFHRPAPRMARRVSPGGALAPVGSAPCSAPCESNKLLSHGWGVAAAHGDVGRRLGGCAAACHALPGLPHARAPARRTRDHAPEQSALCCRDSMAGRRCCSVDSAPRDQHCTDPSHGPPPSKLVAAVAAAAAGAGAVCWPSGALGPAGWATGSGSPRPIPPCPVLFSRAGSLLPLPALDLSLPPLLFLLPTSLSLSSFSRTTHAPPLPPKGARPRSLASAARSRLSWSLPLPGFFPPLFLPASTTIPSQQPWFSRRRSFGDGRRIDPKPSALQRRLSVASFFFHDPPFLFRPRPRTGRVATSGPRWPSLHSGPRRAIATTTRLFSSPPTPSRRFPRRPLTRHVVGSGALDSPEGRRRLCALPQGQDQVRLRKRSRAVQKLRKGHARVLSALGEHGPSPRPESCASLEQRPPPSSRQPPGLRRRCL